jgi:hypothetical protein
MSMEVVAGLAGLVSVLTSWIVGGRLLLLAKQSRCMPEFWIGLGLLLVGGLWSPLMAVGRQAVGLPDAVRTGLVMAGALSAIGGVSCLALFNWRVFRPSDAWAWALVAGLIVAITACFAAQAVAPGWIGYARHEQGPWLLGTWVVAANYVWASFESWRHYVMLARRRKLGLADPVVVDRMRLWALALLASLLASATAAICQSLGLPLGGTALGLWLAGVSALVAACCLWLAFLPPDAYLAWVRDSSR